MKRANQLRIRLAPRTEPKSTVLVLLTEEEREVLAKAAAANGYGAGDDTGGGPGLGTFLRLLGVYASQDDEHTPNDAIRLAAARSGMEPGEWLRTVALGAVGYYELEQQVGAAREALAAGQIAIRR